MLAYPTLILAMLPFCFARTQPGPGQLGITLAFFSGRRDPSWMVNSNKPQYAQIQQLLGQARKTKTAYSPDAMPAKLGYKGYLIQEAGKQSELIVGRGTEPLQKLLLQTMPEKLMKKDFKNRVLSEINSGKAQPQVLTATKLKRYAPLFEMLPWSNTFTRLNNNCYNYANIVVTNTFAQPGLGSGAIFTAMAALPVRTASVNDGLVVVNPHPANTAPVPTRPSGDPHLVALVVDPDTPTHDGDFHWYRLDNDGKWSHKPGETSITRTDDSGNLITDPRLADMGDYQFVSFMYSNRKTVTIA